MSSAMPPDDRYVSADIAARRLGVSSATVRRRIRAGTLEGMIDTRPQGEVYLVLADALPPDISGAEEMAGIAEEIRGNAPVSPDSHMTAIISAAIDPYVAMNERISELYAGAIAENAELSKQLGRTESAVDAYRREAEWLKAELERARGPWWRWWGR